MYFPIIVKRGFVFGGYSDTKLDAFIANISFMPRRASGNKKFKIFRGFSTETALVDIF